MSTTPSWTCSICQQECTGFGNNPAPVNDGKCCDECNWRIVVPIRIHMIGRNTIKTIEKFKDKFDE